VSDRVGGPIYPVIIIIIIINTAKELIKVTPSQLQTVVLLIMHF